MNNVSRELSACGKRHRLTHVVTAMRVSSFLVGLAHSSVRATMRQGVPTATGGARGLSCSAALPSPGLALNDGRTHPQIGFGEPCIATQGESVHVDLGDKVQARPHHRLSNPITLPAIKPLVADLPF